MQFINNRYRVLNQLGSGTQGSVVLALDEKLDREVAIKLLKTEARQSDWANKSFRREAMVMAKFNHQNVVAIYDFDVISENSCPFLVMEYLRGQTIEQLDPKLTDQEFHSMVLQIGSALQCAHNSGFVHRDLKPANLMLVNRGTNDERFVVLDLGIAKLNDCASQGMETFGSMTYASAGTPFYMAPQQVESKSVDNRADIYSFGVIIYEMVAGVPPFWEYSENLRELLNAVVTLPPVPLIEIANRKCSVDLNNLVMQCLEKDPRQRPRTVDEVLSRFRSAYSPILDGAESRVNIADGKSEFGSLFPTESSESFSSTVNSTTGSGVGATLVPIGKSLDCNSRNITSNRITKQSDWIVKRPARGSQSRDGGAGYPRRMFVATCILVALLIASAMPFLIWSNPTQADGTRGMHLEKGEDELSETKVGHQDHSGEVESPNSELNFDFELPKLTKLVAITPTPANAMIKLNGEELEQKEDNMFELSIGDHQLTFAAEGYQDKTVKLSVTDGENEPLSVELERSTARVSIEVKPDDAVITWNEFDHQVTDGVVEIEMPIGQNLIEISRNGCATMTESIEVTDQDITAYKFELPLVVQSKVTPADAEVWINGEMVTANQIDSHTYHLKTGTYIIELKKAGFKALAINLSIGPDQENIIQGELIQLATMNSLTSQKSSSKQLPSMFDATKGAGSDEAGLAQKEWAKYLGQGVEVENEIGMKFRLVPPGEFMIGSPALEQGRDHDEQSPPQRAKIESAFYLGKYEVTQKEWFKVMGTEPWLVSKGKPKRQVETGDEIPASYISWNDAVKFCRRLSKIEGIEYRLPTEKEWEYSCRAGTTTAFSFGNDKSKMLKFAQYREDNYHTRGFARPVGQKTANAWGLHDMHGNIWEWCSDTYLTSGYEVAKVRRGGAWNSSWRECRSANRSRSWSNNIALDPTEGFRVVRVMASNLDPQTSGKVPRSNSVAKSGNQILKKVPPGLFDARKGATESEAVAAQREWAKYLDQEVETENKVSMELVLIPPGDFKMGSSRYEEARDKYEGPIHDVQISRPFYLSQYEVTQEQWLKVMGTRPWMDGAKARAHVRTGAHYPASYVSWNDAATFCKELSRLEGVEYRLPTEAEWEYACRSGSTTSYHFGDSGLGPYAWFSENSSDEGETYAHPVGVKRKNSWGLYDMHGNVWEWCSDWFDSETYSQSENVDPKGSKDGTYKIYRGGSWYFKRTFCRSASRFWSFPEIRESYIGFRVVRTCIPSTQ